MKAHPRWCSHSSTRALRWRLIHSGPQSVASKSRTTQAREPARHSAAAGRPPASTDRGVGGGGGGHTSAAGPPKLSNRPPTAVELKPGDGLGTLGAINGQLLTVVKPGPPSGLLRRSRNS